MDVLLADATLRGASDIHFEPESNFLRIRYRVDGVLRQVRVLHLRYWSAMVVRLKVMAGMNIAETRAPQDGRISLSISGRQVDFRSAVQPIIHGENFVLRILDRTRNLVPIDGLGLSEKQLTVLLFHDVIAVVGQFFLILVVFFFVQGRIFFGLITK